MSNYTKTTNFTAKDSLLVGDPNKIIKGTEHDVEYDAIATAVNSKANTSSPTFTGTANFSAIASGALTGTTINNSVIGGSTPAAGTFSTFTLASGTTATAILDEDTLVSNSATALATQQSIKAYVDAQVISAGPLLTTGTITTNDFARFTNSTTLEGRSAAEVKADLGLEGVSTQFGDDPLTYSTLKLVGYESADAFELDSDRELIICGDHSTPESLSCVVYNKTTSTWGTEASISSSDIYLGAIKIDTDKVLIAYSDEVTTLKFRVLTFSGTSVTVNTEYTSAITAINGQNAYFYYGYGLFDCGTSYVVTYPSASGSANQIAVAATVSGTTVTIGSENTIQASAQNLYTISPASGYVAFATNDGTNFKVLSYSISGTTLTSINSGTHASTLSSYFEYSYIGKTSGNHYLYKQNQSTDMDLVVATFDGSYNVTVTGYAGFLGDDFNFGSTTAAIFDDSNNAIVCTSEGATYVNIYDGDATSVGTSIQVYNANYAYATDDAIYVNSSNAIRKKFSFNSGSILEEPMNKFNVTTGFISSKSMSNGAVTNNLYALYNASSLHISNSETMYSNRTSITVGLANTINRSDDSVVFTPQDSASVVGITIAGVTDARYGYAYDAATTNYYIQRVSL